MQLQRESSQVMSARITWFSSAGSANSIHSRGNPSATSFTSPDYGAPEGHYGRRMRLGVLDVGSNTVHLLVVDAHPGARPIPTASHKSVLRLMRYLDDDGSISPEGVDAILTAVRDQVALARDAGIEEFLAFATSAIREATNGEEVLARVEAEAG